MTKRTRAKYDFRGNLIRVGGDAKTVKGEGDFITGIMYLISWTQSGIGNVCPNAVVAGCINGCLVSAGRGTMANVHKGRLRKTEWFFDDRAGFMAQLVEDFERLLKYCAKHNVKPAIRLNGTSDIRFENIPVVRGGHTCGNIMIAFPEVQFYNYTKIANSRVEHKTPGNYHLTFSYSKASLVYEKQVKTALENGMNIACVWRDESKIPAEFLGRKVINGDETDMRFLDPAGVVVGLYAKGKAKKDTSGFVLD